MKTLSLVFRILAILGASMAIAAVFMTQSKVSDMEKGKETAESKARDLMVQVEEGEDALAEQKDKEEAFKAAVKKAEAKANTSNSYLLSEQSKTKAAQAAKKAAEQKYIAEKKKIAKLKGVISELEENQGVSPEELKSLSIEMVKLETANAGLKKDLDAAVRKIEAVSEAVVAGPKKLANAVDASVVAVDSRSGLLIINAGKSEIQKDMQMYIKKNGVRLARVQVAKVVGGQSVVNILPGFSVTKSLHANDQIQLVP